MAVWFVSDVGRQAMGGQVAATSALTTVTSSATTNQPGNWTQMHAAAPFPVNMITVFSGNGGIFLSGANTQTLFDVGIGTAPEQVVIQDVAIGGIAQFAVWQFPLSVPVNSRIVMRLRSMVASKAAPFGMTIMGGGFGLESGNRAITYGATQASSIGTTLGTPATANTKAATWTQITAATTAPMRWMSLGLSAPNTLSSSAANGLLDIGVGAASSEKVLIADVPFRTSTAEDILAAFPMIYPVNLPAGVRLSARVALSVVAAGACPTLTITGIY